MAIFKEDHVGMVSIVINRRTKSATPTIIGVAGNTEGEDDKIIRAINLSSPVVADTATQQKIQDLVDLVQGLLKTQEGIV